MRTLSSIKGNCRANLAEFIRLCRDDLTAFGDDLEWDKCHWPKVCRFTKLGTPQSVTKAAADMRQLDIDFIDFAKACVRYEHTHNPGSVAKIGRNITALRLLEKSLLDLKGSADPISIDVVVLDHAAKLGQSHFGRNGYESCQRLRNLAIFLTAHHLVSVDLSYWKHPLRAYKNVKEGIGPESDELRRKKMPDPDALNALAEIFSSNLDSKCNAQHRDIYTTSVCAMLLSAPSRGSEIHDLPVDLEVEEIDRRGDSQYGFRYFSGKGYGGDVKWVPEVMVPVAKLAVKRLHEITNDARKLALYIERQLEQKKANAHAEMRFFRHTSCPDVPDDQPLTAEQASKALGYANFECLRKAGLSRKNGAYTLNTLWQWVLTQQPPDFPWLNRAKKIRFSSALFCMFKSQLGIKRSRSPVILWAPKLVIFCSDCTPNSWTKQNTIFQRYGYLKPNGEQLRLNSHSLRHYINTLAQKGNMTQEEIAKWSGRTNHRANRIYNHESESDVLNRARRAMQSGNAENNATEDKSFVSEEDATHWTVTSDTDPISFSDLRLSPRGASHLTLWGRCVHDFLLSPCEKFADCLNCEEHFCTKSDSNGDKDRLSRLKSLLVEVEQELNQAKICSDAGDPGAAAWYESHRKYRARLLQLVRILEDPKVPNQSVISLYDGTAKTHLLRIINSVSSTDGSRESLANKDLRKLTWMSDHD